MTVARTMGWAIGIAAGLTLLACHPPSPVAPPTPPLPTPLNPTSGDVAQEILDASIVSDAGLREDVAVLDAGGIPAHTF